MARQRTKQIILGMARDNALSRTSENMSYENKNVRLTATDDDHTLTAITNEKGTFDVGVDVHGEPKGTFVCNQYFGIFSVSGVNNNSVITIYEKENETYSERFRYTDLTGVLDFESTDFIETIVSVESSESIRVYWIDGVHEMRVIDFKKLMSKYNKDAYTSPEDGEIIIQSAILQPSYFSTLPKIERIDFQKVDKLSTGYFYSGTVQFVITELINGNESNIVYYSPLYYVSDDSNNRGFAPDNTTNGIGFTVSFNIHERVNVESKISQFNVYCIHRSGKDGAATVYYKDVKNTDVDSNGSLIIVSFIGTESTVDSTYLNFKNTASIKGIQTFAHKDNTLFIGNYKIEDAVDEDIESAITISEDGITTDYKDDIPTGVFNGSKYTHVSQLKYNSFQIGHFKYNETYLLGYQLMNDKGTWSEPQYIDHKKMTLSPVISDDNLKLPCFAAEFEVNTDKYIAIRPVVSYLSDARKRCLYQGFVTPTIFSEQERINNICYSKYSPFARTVRNNTENSIDPQFTGNINPMKVYGGRYNCERLHYSHPFGRFNIESETFKPYSTSRFIKSWLGYNSTIVHKDYYDYFVDNMMYGTYPANQHLSALGSAKDYNCEIQSQVIPTDVVFKTAVYPVNIGTISGDKGNLYLYKEIVYISDIKATFYYYYYPSTNTKFYLGSGRNLNGYYLVEDAVDFIETVTEDGISINKYSLKEGYDFGDATNGMVIVEGEVMIDDLSVSVATFTSNWTSEGYTVVITDASNDDYEGFEDSYEEEKSIFNIDNTKYYVDASVVSFHSPDISLYGNSVDSDSKLDIVGAMEMDGFSSDCSIVASTPALFDSSDGNEGFQHFTPSNTKSGRCAMTLPNWCASWENGAYSGLKYLYWAVYPFGRNRLGQINNDSAGASDTSKLTYKQLSNYRYSGITNYYNSTDELSYDNSNISYVSGELNSIARVRNEWYKGAEDCVVNTSSYQFVTNGLAQRKSDSSTILSPLIFAQNYRAQILDAVNVVRTPDGNPTKYCFVSVPSQQHYDRYAKNQSHYCYNGFWKNAGIRAINKLNELYVINDESTLNSISGIFSNSDNYSDDNYTQNEEGVNWSYNTDRDNWGNDGAYDQDDAPTTMQTNMKYLASPHFVIDLGKTNDKWNILPNTGFALTNMQSILAGDSITNYISVFNSSGKTTFDNACPFNIGNEKEFPSGVSGDAMWVADIIRPDYNESEAYLEDVDNNTTTQWYIAGNPVYFEDLDADTGIIKWLQGNWYFQRWECLRTFAESIEDVNQVVEIVSALLETRTNIDGRYDANRGYPMLNANMENFNLINDSYSQLNNFFTYYRTSLKENYNVTDYPSSIAWSLPKVLNSEVDAWTAITGQSYIDMDGDKGSVTKLTRFGNELFCFQPRGVSRILYNSRTQISTEDGTPIEIGYSGKVEGKLYISNNIGAQNKRQIITTDSGIYFADIHNKSLMLFSDKMQSLSESLGFHSWAIQNSNNPLLHMWDARHKSVVIVNVDEALSYSEVLQHYESFFDYGSTFDMLNVQEDTLMIHTNDEDKYKVWRMNGGDYNNFFGDNKGWYVKYAISTRYSDGRNVTDKPNDKIWDNVEFRGDVYDDGVFTPTECPYNYIQAETEYQDSGKKVLTFERDKHQNISNLKQKFRIWHCIIPRDEKEHKIGRIKNRIRNPWVYLTMGYNTDSNPNRKAIVQDFYCDYYE